MVNKIILVGMIFSTHSLGLIISSLFTNKWHVEQRKEIGIFGVCYYYRSSTLLVSTTGNSTTTTTTSSRSCTQPCDTASANAKCCDNNNNNDDKSSSITQIPIIHHATTATTTTMDVYKSSVSVDDTAIISRDKTTPIQATIKVHKKCFQLIWPDTLESINYLKAMPVYFTIMMSSAIASALFGCLTFVWSTACLFFKELGAHCRANECLIMSCMLTECFTASTFGLFAARDGKLYSLKYYGYSFWFSVAGALGLCLASVLFVGNRISLAQKCKMRKLPTL